jgi:hypothetical protein
MKCRICGEEISIFGISKHLSKHNLKVEQYYLKFHKKCKCLTCGNNTEFISLTIGYRKYCSRQCAYNSSVRTNKIKNTNIERYGVSNQFKREEVKNKIKKTNLKKYGVTHVSKRSDIKVRKVNTCLHNFGVDNPSKCKSIKEKTKRTNLEKYGFQYSTQNKVVKNKIKVTSIERYGSSNPLLSDEVKNKVKRTNLERYGVDNPFKSKEIRKKIKKTNIEKYGCENPAQNKRIHKKIFSHRRKNNHGYLSKPEYKFSKYLIRSNIEFKNEYLLNGHHFDFAIFKSGKLDTVVDIDGEYYHGLLCDKDGWYVKVNKDYKRFSILPKKVKLLIIDSKRIKEGIKELKYIIGITYNSYRARMLKYIPKDIPYYHFDKSRMRKDYKKLCTYEYSKLSDLGKSVILNFCKSKFKNLNWNIIRKSIYYSICSDHSLLEGLDNSLNVSELRNEYKKRYEGIEIVRHKKYSPEKMLAVCSLGKKYIATCFNKEEYIEGCRIVKFLKLSALINNKE